MSIMNHTQKLIVCFSFGTMFLLHPIYYLVINNVFPSALQLYIDILAGYLFTTVGIFLFIDERRKKVE